MPNLTFTSAWEEDIAVIQGAYREYAAPSQDELLSAESCCTDYGLLPLASIPCTDVPLAVVDDGFLFKSLVDQWHKERGASSSVTEIISCPAYQKIIGMGEKAIPFILGELELKADDPDQWFWALQAITSLNPVSEEDEGDSVKMAISWRKELGMKGYAW